ncbi:hypothetical protein ZOSMA_778G00020 [Zostera marina]|uniref:Uncharacterized protein n=1 Tax=Zostera marina TaxID=29655 RepID=A0A0K9NR27_ZOSMR|nr:hypothetical protein ZOSMA_778G00020 [Zostera marina]
MTQQTRSSYFLLPQSLLPKPERRRTPGGESVYGLEWVRRIGGPGNDGDPTSRVCGASTRHYLLRLVIKDHPTLCILVLTDADDQGTLTMGKEQLREFREKPLAASASSSRTQVPTSNMKLKETQLRSSRRKSRARVGRII